MGADTVVNLAKFAWDVIKEGKAAAAIDGSTANAVPHVDDWQSLTDVRGPNVHRLYDHVSYVWPLDDYDHTQIEILVKWQYGARYKGGGAYIPNLWIEVPQCFVGWPWSADIGITVHNPTNVGDQSAPLAALPVTVKGTVSSGAELYHVEWGLMIYGNGHIETT